MGPFGRSAVGLIVSKDGASKKKDGAGKEGNKQWKGGEDSGVGGRKSGRRSSHTLLSWVKDDVPEEKVVKEGKEKAVRQGKDKSRRSVGAGKTPVTEEVEMEISAPILIEDFHLASSILVNSLGLNRIKTRSGPLFAPSTQSGPLFTGTLQSRFGTGNDGRIGEGAAPNSSKGETSTRQTSGIRRASKVHARNSVSPKDSTVRKAKFMEAQQMDCSPQKDDSPGSSIVKKLQRSKRISNPGRVSSREVESTMSPSGSFGKESASGVDNSATSRCANVDSSFDRTSTACQSFPEFTCWNNQPTSSTSPQDGASMDLKSSEAAMQECESPTSPGEGVKETESPRFQALLRMTSRPRKGKLPTDKKSYSHELDPRGVRSHEFLRPRSINHLEEVLQTLRARFNTAKEEVNAELAVFAGDLLEILERNPDAEADWQERIEDLLILANQCAVMVPDEFLQRCEGIVHNLDEKRQELPIGKLKTLHTRMLFILTRCTRLLQYLKENGLDEDGSLYLFQHRVYLDQSLEKHWNSVLKVKKTVGSDPVKVCKSDSQPHHWPHDTVPVPRRSKEENAKSGSMATIKELESKEDLLPKDGLKEGLSKGKSASMVPNLSLWKKRSSVDSKPVGAKDLTESEKALCNKEQKADTVHDQDSLALKTSKSAPPSISLQRQQRAPWGYWGDPTIIFDDNYMVICRICEEEVPTLRLEEHSRVCAFADRCDHKGLAIDERLQRLAETLEWIAESYTPKSSLTVAGRSPDNVKTSIGGDASDTSLSEKLDIVSEKLGALERTGGELLRRPSQDMLDDLHVIDTASIVDEPRVFNAIACKARFGPKSDPLITFGSSVGSVMAPSSSVGSSTPRSPLMTPKTSQIDLLLSERNNFAEEEDIPQVSGLHHYYVGYLCSLCS
jgi:hypothetical protein